MHIAKYKGVEARRQIKHDLDFETRKNEHHINGTLMSQNIYLTQIRTSEEALNKYDQLMQNVDAKIKTDTVTLASIICTLPKELEDANKEYQVDFLLDAAKELMSRTGGSKNLLYAVIHYDEPDSRPHLEYKFCPIIEGKDARCKDKDKIIRKFSFDKLCDREFYTTLHQDVQKALKSKGYDCTLVNDVTIRQMRQMLKNKAINGNDKDAWAQYYDSGNKTIQELKDQSAADLVKTRVQLSKTKEALKQAQKTLNEIAPLHQDAPQKTFDKPIASIYDNYSH